MAFVVKSKKETEIKIGETESLGPGEYLPQTELKTIKINKEPFLIGEKRTTPKIDEVPGPGAYYQDEMLLKYDWYSTTSPTCIFPLNARYAVKNRQTALISWLTTHVTEPK